MFIVARAHLRASSGGATCFDGGPIDRALHSAPTELPNSLSAMSYKYFVPTGLHSGKVSAQKQEVTNLLCRGADPRREKLKSGASLIYHLPFSIYDSIHEL
jgi:hypothetical protein